MTAFFRRHSGGAVLLILLLVVTGHCQASDITAVSLPLIPNMTRADIYYVEPDDHPVACLVMCPGINGNGKHYLSRRDVQEFADRYRLAVVGLSFASDETGLQSGTGYYYASQGSGQLLLDGIDKNIQNGIPLLLYGFSGGAHFVSNFQECFPNRVMAWCAYTAAWWGEPKLNDANPPGIVACGRLDTDRYGPSFDYFEKGRRLGKPWCWISLANTNHGESDALNHFVELYFSGILDKISDTGSWYDINTGQRLNSDDQQKSANAAWLPSDRIGEAWSEVHKP